MTQPTGGREVGTESAEAWGPGGADSAFVAYCRMSRMPRTFHKFGHGWSLRAGEKWAQFQHSGPLGIIGSI